MRDIWIRDAEGRQLRDLGGCGLSTEVWNSLYPLLAGNRNRPILARLWHEQWGPAADASLSPSEVEALASELDALRAELGPETPAVVREFCVELAALCGEARQRGSGLEFVAD